MKHILTLLTAVLLATVVHARELTVARVSDHTIEIRLAPKDDTPLVNDRLVFNWHNFLSGCSAWNLADWNRWTDDSHKLGYNAIMVHAYGNNPMAGFSFQRIPVKWRGSPKP
jgi:hypothetical protein